MPILPRFINVSFSGAGHLLPYHLGASVALLKYVGPECTNTVEKKGEGNSLRPTVRAVAGSSSGAIAAVLLARLPDHIEEYADRFIQTKGKALESLTQLLLSTSSSALVKKNQNDPLPFPPDLYVATTRCLDGSLHFFHFRPESSTPSSTSSLQEEAILQSVKASCQIPQSFHPLDMVTWFPFRNHTLSYPEEDGILIDGVSYVDGGIVAPCPKIPHQEDNHQEGLQSSSSSLLISPISYTSTSSSLSTQQLKRISPRDDTWRLLPTRNVTMQGDFPVKPSVQNLHALRIASGATTSAELKDWYHRGMDDAKEVLLEWNKKKL